MYLQIQDDDLNNIVSDLFTLPFLSGLFPRSQAAL